MQLYPSWRQALKPTGWPGENAEHCIPNQLWCSMGILRPSNTVSQPFKEQVPFIGTPCFASICTLLSIQQSCQDDLELLTYMVIYLVCGSLPWQETTSISQIIDLKVCIGHSLLIRDIPPEFLTVLEHAWSLAFDECPDYAYLHGLFEKLKVNNVEFNCVWVFFYQNSLARHSFALLQQCKKW